MLELSLLKRYPGFTLDVALEAGDGITALVGPSGAGKTQTVRAVAGAMHPDRGRIVLDGEVLFDSSAGIDLAPQKRHVGYVPQQYALFPHLDVAANVGFGLKHRGRAEAQARVAETIHLVGLDGLAGRRPRELSGGQQQRVALARALILEPKILLLDEPFAALDSEIREVLRRELADLQQRLGFRALLVSHDREDLALADRSFRYEAGRIVNAPGASDAYRVADDVPAT